MIKPSQVRVFRVIRRQETRIRRTRNTSPISVTSRSSPVDHPERGPRSRPSALRRLSDSPGRHRPVAVDRRAHRRYLHGRLDYLAGSKLELLQGAPEPYGTCQWLYSFYRRRAISYAVKKSRLTTAQDVLGKSLAERGADGLVALGV